MAYWVKVLDGLVPFNRLDDKADGKYCHCMFGSRKIQVKVLEATGWINKTDELVVKVGGGFMLFSEYIDTYGQQELDRQANKPEKRVTHVAKKVHKDAGPSIGLGVADLQTVHTDELLSRTLNETQDSYVQACIKQKLLDSVLFLRNAANFPIGYQNAIGNTMLHNAIAGGDSRVNRQLVKAVITERLGSEADKLMIDAESLKDIKGNFRQGL